MRTGKKWLSVLALAGVALLVFGACAPAAAPTGTPTKAPPPSATTPTAKPGPD